MIKWHVDKIKGIVLQTNCEKWDSNQAEQSHTFDPSQPSLPGTYSASLLLQLRFMPVGRFGTPVLYHLITLQYLRTSSYTDSARTLQSSKQFRLKLCSQSIIRDFPCSVNFRPCGRQQTVSLISGSLPLLILTCLPTLHPCLHLSNRLRLWTKTLSSSLSFIYTKTLNVSECRRLCGTCI